MKNKFLVWALSLLLTAPFSEGQSGYADSIRSSIETTQNDTLKLNGFIALVTWYMQISPDSCIRYSEKLLNISKKLDLRLNQVYALYAMAYALQEKDKYVESLTMSNTALALAEDPASEKNVLPAKYAVNQEYYVHPQSPHFERIEQLASVKMNTMMLYLRVKDVAKELELINEARALAVECGNERILSTVNLLAGIRFNATHQSDSALNVLKLAYDQALRSGFKKFLGSIMLNLGGIYLKMGHKDEAISYYRKAIAYNSSQNYLRGVVAAELVFSQLYQNSAQRDSSLYYANDALRIAESMKEPNLELRSYQRLAAYYDSVKIKDSIIKYQALVIQYKNKIDILQQTSQFGIVEIKEQKRLQDLEVAQKEYRHRQQTYGYVAGLSAFLLIAILLWRNNKNIQRANRSLKLQKEETELQKSKVEQMFTALQSTQAQLIQSEKMASLGELTAGIAHEIQNPLNFVNNFSEVNDELIEEMDQAMDKENYLEARSISTNIRQNLDKISQHGKRADAIVKSMLQHSRTSSLQKEPTDINTLADESLRLSFLGMRAKDKSFTCDMKTDFDRSIGKINVIPEDLRRVLVNLYNNSFYSLSQKCIKSDGNFKPEIFVSTARKEKNIELRVRDNGLGIPRKIMDKIFQPFFTSKPAGQGTGLGLSLAYDIIVKEHGGELTMNSEEGNLAEFVIRFPLTNSTEQK
ncbi:MAG: ATP-binding protein [Chitinophagales bacterium]